jgi:hypothetical protein
VTIVHPLIEAERPELIVLSRVVDYAGFSYSAAERGHLPNMKSLSRFSLLILLLGAFVTAANADTPGKHPYYLHALDDLRDARAHLDRLGPDDRIDNEQQRAIDEIDAAIGEIKRASIDDGKDLRDHPPIDAHLKRTDRYHRALELLDKAHKDVKHEEDDPYAQGLQDRALRHIDEAHHTVEHIVHSMD